MMFVLTSGNQRAVIIIDRHRERGREEGKERGRREGERGRGGRR